jgi:hypothetical protein
VAESAKVRVREPRREGQQVVTRIREDSLPLEHPARLFWEVFGLLDLGAFTAGAKSVWGAPGGSLKSRRMLLTLWAYAFARGIPYAREIERRLIDNDLGFRWIAGDMHVSHTLLSEFLAEHLGAMQTLFTNVLGVLKSHGLLFLPEHYTAQDGTRVRANAGIASFRTRAGLDEAREQAELHIKAILARVDEPALREAEQQARERGAMDVLDRIGEAVQVVKALQEQRSNSSSKKRQTTEPKASTTDPEARLMKVSNGGFEPSYNVQLAVVGSPMGGPATIIGVQVTSLGTDKHSILPMHEQVEQRTGYKLDTILVDGDHLTHDELRAAQAKSLMVVAPVPKRWETSEAPQDPEIARWIAEMKTAPRKIAYRARKSLAERANAILKERFKLRRIPVRGRRVVLCVFLLAAVVANLMQHGLSLMT